MTTAIQRKSPVEYSDELGRQICGMVANGLSLRTIENIRGMPRRSSIVQWIVENRFPELTARYRRARAVWIETIADDLLDLADEPYARLIETRVTKNGATITREVIDYEAVRARALKIDTRKWLLSKLMPKVYGEFVHLYQETETRHRITLEGDMPDWMGRAISALQHAGKPQPVVIEQALPPPPQSSKPASD